MDKNQIIEVKVKNFISKDALFTSVDIANSIKKDGHWVRNVEVRDWLRNNFQSSDIFGDYETEVIEVCGGTRIATLYRPCWSDAHDYEERDQTALTPDDVNIISNKVHDNSVSSLSTKNNDKKDDDIITMISPKGVSIRRKISSKERIKIPGRIIKRLGLNPGDKINPSQIKTHKPIPSRLIVNADFRVSIPRNCLNWGTEPVNVMLKGDNIIFEKA